MQQKFWTADLHFGHDAVLRYTKRGELFSDINEHDRFIVRTLNQQVMPSDELYILGDISFHNRWQTGDLIEQLTVRRKHLVLGNHDEALEEFYRASGLFISVSTRLKFTYYDRHVVMDHHPEVEWHRCQYGSWMLHGHTHGNFDYVTHGLQDYKIFDVGFDNSPNYRIDGLLHPDHHGYKAFPFKWLNEYMQDKKVMPHHGQHR